MSTGVRTYCDGLIVSLGAAGCAGGALAGRPGLAVAAGALTAGYTALRWAAHRVAAPVVGGSSAAQRAALELDDEDNDDDVEGDSVRLVSRLLKQDRYALLLREQIAAGLSLEQRRAAWWRLDEQMSLVPGGDVFLEPCRSAIPSGGQGAGDDGRLVTVEPVFLDRCAVSNAQFARFVNAGGYQDMGLWDPEILPALLDFVDRTGRPGPRYWRDGHCEPGYERHPVVGVCWYEAAAYARWAGKRLPTDAEWVKAGGWPSPLPGGRPVQRKYPWGDVADRRRANLWGAGPESTVPVDAYPEGVSVGGVHQLIGNVWEWTSSPLAVGSRQRLESTDGAPLRSIRGGAFDTYFDNQAACQFQSGDSPLARKHNIGFRCAVSVCDLTPAPDDDAADDDLATQPAEAACA